MKPEPQMNRYFYIAGWILMALFAMGAAVIHIKGKTILNYVPPCMFHRVTGYYCPGCGGTRAFILFFRGELFLSLCYHPAVLTLAVCYLHFIILYLYRRSRHNKVTYRKEIPVQIYAYVFIGIVLLQWFVKLFLIYLKLKGH